MSHVKLSKCVVCFDKRLVYEEYTVQSGKEDGCKNRAKLMNSQSFHGMTESGERKKV